MRSSACNPCRLLLIWGAAQFKHQQSQQELESHHKNISLLIMIVNPVTTPKKPGVDIVQVIDIAAGAQHKNHGADTGCGNQAARREKTADHSNIQGKGTVIFRTEKVAEEAETSALEWIEIV